MLYIAHTCLRRCCWHQKHGNDITSFDTPFERRLTSVCLKIPDSCLSLYRQELRFHMIRNSSCTSHLYYIHLCFCLFFSTLFSFFFFMVCRVGWTCDNWCIVLCSHSLFLQFQIIYFNNEIWNKRNSISKRTWKAICFHRWYFHIVRHKPI